MQSPTSPRLIGTIFLSLLVSTQTTYGAQEDDATNAISHAVKTLRIHNEQMESTDQYVKSLQLYHVKSLSYPVSWGFNLGTETHEPRILFSKKMSNIVTNKMLYKPTTFSNGMINVGAPLTNYFTYSYAPLLSENQSKDLRLIYIQPITPFILAADSLKNSYIDFCSFKPVKKVSKTSEMVMIHDLAELETAMKNFMNLTSNVSSSGDFYIPSVYSSEIIDTEFMGLPAKRLTIVFDGFLNNTPNRLKYEGVYALKNGYVICGEVVAPDKNFAEFRKTFDAITKTIVPPYEFSSLGIKSSSSSSAPSKRVLKAKDRLCKRTKKC